MRVARPFQARVAGLKAPRYINIENALIRLRCIPMWGCDERGTYRRARAGRADRAAPRGGAGLPRDGLLTDARARDDDTVSGAS